MTSAHPLAMPARLWRHRDLIRQFTTREVLGRYRGSYLGLLWSVITPLVMLAVYTFVFAVVFAARWSAPGASAGTGDYALTIFCGLLVFGLFAECVTRAPELVRNHPNYVKKVVFPLEVLPVAVLGSACVHAAIGLVILLAAELVTGRGIAPAVLWFPLVALPLACLALGLSWFLASLGVFVRDVGYAVAIATQVLFFLTPIFYPASAVPGRFRIVIALNPLAAIVESSRRVLLWGQPPLWSSLAAALGAGFLVLAGGYLFFMRSRRAFADVI